MKTDGLAIFERNANHTPFSETVLGLHLLYLLVENRLADFHCQLELLSEESHKSPAVLFCTQLEKHLVVGAYDEVCVIGLPPSYTCTPTYFFTGFSGCCKPSFGRLFILFKFSLGNSTTKHR
jgi:hypothetical protein